MFLMAKAMPGLNLTRLIGGLLRAKPLRPKFSFRGVMNLGIGGIIFMDSIRAP
jgi:hypothetical protein